MVWRLVVMVSAVTALATANDLNLKFAENDDLIETINKVQTAWKAGRNFPVGTTKAQVRRLMGAKKWEGGDDVIEMKQPSADNIEIPDTFDSRDQWPKCETIRDIKDQSDCGSCWAVAGASAFSDRLCIFSNGTIIKRLSSREVLSCCKTCGEGCNGGYGYRAWNYFRDHGIVTGGEHGSKEGCQPYPLKPCEHHVNGSRIPCPDMHDPPTPKCYNKCTNPKYQGNFQKDHWKTKSSYRLDSRSTEIQKEILQNGPVEAVFTLYEDFLSYKSGVYYHVTGAEEGGHAVRVIGWGVENGIPYWLVTNSWNTDWGDKGLLKIRRGTDECGFEFWVTAGEPDV